MASAASNNNNIAQVHVLPILSDNYSYLIVDKQSHQAALVDPAEPEKVLAQFNEINNAQYNGQLQLAKILTTHKHWDHAGGNAALAKQFPSLQIYGNATDEIPAMNSPVSDKDTFSLGSSLTVNVIFAPCHTKGHVLYHVTDTQQQLNWLFSGDTFFVGGCGRFFEGDGSQMVRNVERIKQRFTANLLASTLMYCGHEYTVKNLEFVRDCIEPESEHVKEALQRAKQLRSEGKPTVPSTLADEFLYNPFFRVWEASVQKAVNTLGDPVATMTAVRAKKDKY